jgi:Calcineurin-like phosphoesterase
MSQLAASFFHLTDLHLHVDSDGHERDPRTIARLIFEWDERVPWSSAAAMMWHSDSALVALGADLRDRVADELEEAAGAAPVFVAQTGDVEALGVAVPDAADWRDAFPSWAYLDELADDCAGQWIHTFGNHDVWDGVFPLFRPWGPQRRRWIASVDPLRGDWTRPHVDRSASVPLVVAQLNTVDGSWLAEVLARGRVRPFPSRDVPMAQVLEELHAQFGPFRETEAIRVVLLHNPPHAFAATRRDAWSTAYLAGAEELAATLSELRVQIVLAGHRHAIDPPAEAKRYGFRQRPLREPTVQLVAESPTQRWPHNDKPSLLAAARRSYCRYRFVVDDAAETFSVLRTVYRYTSALGVGGFRPTPSGEREVFAQLPLK